MTTVANLRWCIATLIVFSIGLCLATADTVDISFVHISSPATAYYTAQLYCGVMAAQKYANDHGILNNGQRSLNISFVQGIKPTDNPATWAAAVISRNASLILNPDWASSDALFPAIQGTNQLVVSPLTTSTDADNAQRNPNVIFSGPSLFVEYLEMLNHAMHSDARCVQFGIVWQPFSGVDRIIAGITAATALLGLPTPLNISAGATLDTASVLAQWLAVQSAVPGCGLLFMPAASVVTLLEAFYGSSSITFSDTYFYISSYSRTDVFTSSTLGTKPFVNLRLTQGVNNPSDATISSVKVFRSAFTAWLATAPSLPSQIVSDGGAIDSNFTSLAYEGFLLGMFCSRLVSSANVANLVSSIYASKFYFFEEITWGPFTNDTVISGKSALPAACNQGGRTTFLSKCSSALTTFLADDSSKGELNVASMTVPLGICSVDATTLVSPLTIVIAGPDFSNDAASLLSFTKLSTAMTRVFYSVNLDKKAASVGRFAVLWRSDFTPGVTNATSYLDRLAIRNKPLALVGGYVGTGTSGIPSFYEAASSMSIYDPPLTKATPYSHNTFQFLPVLADYIHTCIAYVAHISTPGVRVFVTTDDANFLAAIVKSCNTFQIDPEHVDTDCASSSSALALAQNIFAIAVGGDKVVLVFGSNIRANFIAAFNITLAYALTMPTDVRSRVVLVVPVNVAFLTYYMGLANKLPIPGELQVIFSTYLPEFWVSTSTVAQRVMSVFNSTSKSYYTDAVTVRGVIAAEVIYKTTLAISGVAPSAETLTTQAYRAGTISALGLTYGPIYKEPCSDAVIASQTVDRTCQCYKGIRKLFALSVKDLIDGTEGRTGYFFYAMSTCGVKYEPLVVPAKLNVGMIVGIVVPCSIAVVVAIAILVYFATRSPRDNRRAPKDANEPFAVVFTDIQSSTSLWARCPQDMSESVEVHHDEIRELIREYGGYEVKTIGDSFMVAFKETTPAALFALAIQTVFFKRQWPKSIDETYRDLAAEADELQEASNAAGGSTTRVDTSAKALPQWADDLNYPLNWNGIRVRVGMHYGVGSVKLDPVTQGYDYYGTLVNTAARVEGVGNGGQVLATKDFFENLEANNFNFEDVFVTPMGPQPLRGLDAPIPLFQMCPMSLKGRQFNALRLDVEIDVTSEAGTESQSMHDSSSDMSQVTPEILAERTLSKKKGSASLVEASLRMRMFFDMLLSTSSISYRDDLLKHFAKKWHIHLRSKPKRADKAQTEQIYALNSTELVCRVALSLNSLGRKGRWALGIAGDDADVFNASATQSILSDGGAQRPFKRRASRYSIHESSVLTVTDASLLSPTARQ